MLYGKCLDKENIVYLEVLPIINIQIENGFKISYIKNGKFDYQIYETTSELNKKWRFSLDPDYLRTV